MPVRRARAGPHFVMELVRGVPITDYCDQNRLTTRERLELFTHVCQAVQHAHHKGIIHRDIKPSNVMVTLHDGVPVVKVIDFGIAKALGQQLTDKTLFTGFAQMVGTPLYMSPEQAQLSGLDIDTRSDIYSLGVLLYELLTGTTPFDKERLRTAGYDEMRRIIREEEPPRPSTRLSTLGQAAVTVSAAAAERSAAAEPALARRAGLDRDEGAGEGPQPALRDGQRAWRADVAALPARRAGGWPARRRPGIASASSRGGTRRGCGSPRRRPWCCCWLAAGVSWALVGPGSASQTELSGRTAETEQTVNAALITDAAVAQAGWRGAERDEPGGGRRPGAVAPGGSVAGPGGDRLEDRNGRRPSASAGAGRAAADRTATGAGAAEGKPVARPG